MGTTIHTATTATIVTVRAHSGHSKRNVNSFSAISNYVLAYRRERRARIIRHANAILEDVGFF